MRKLKKYFRRLFGKRDAVRKNFYSRDLLAGSRTSITVGEYTYGCPEVVWGEDASLTIGKFCSFAGDVLIILGGGHRVDWLTTYPFPALVDEWPEAAGIVGHPVTKGNIVIGNDVWIAHGATILSGVRIGDGAVVGARSVVTSDVPPYGIVAGNPAKLIRRRFDDATIDALLRLRWWDWPTDKIRDNMVSICSNNIDVLLALQDK